jgi:thiosulfate dehydrogenase [quinone] large subunit
MDSSSVLLSTEGWLVFLRIAVGLWWLKSFFHKPLRRFVEGQMADWTISLAENHPSQAFGNLVKSVVGPTRAWFPYLILFAELAVGIGLVLGFLTPIAAIVAIFLNINYLLLAGVRPRDKSVNPCYQCEQGQNLLMIAIELVILGTGAWAIFSLDVLLGLFPI